MLLTRIGTIVAWLLLVAGGAHLTVGFLVAYSDVPDPALTRLLGSASPAKAVQEGGIAILCALALGIFADISRSLRRNADRE